VGGTTLYMSEKIAQARSKEWITGKIMERIIVVNL
jgi:hypothetical protein